MLSQKNHAVLYLQCFFTTLLLITTDVTFASGGISDGGGNTIDQMMLESTAKTLQEIPQGEILHELTEKISMQYLHGKTATPYNVCFGNNELFLKNWNGYSCGNAIYSNVPNFSFLNSQEKNFFLTDPKTCQYIDLEKESQLAAELKQVSDCFMGTFTDSLTYNTSPLFYFSSRDLAPLAKANLGIPFDTDQTALQTEHEIFIDEKKFQFMNIENQRLLILHEIIMYNMKLIAKAGNFYHNGIHTPPSSTSIHSMTRFMTVQYNLFLKNKISKDQLKKNILLKMSADTDFLKML